MSVSVSPASRCASCDELGDLVAQLLIFYAQRSHCSVIGSRDSLEHTQLAKELLLLCLLSFHECARLLLRQGGDGGARGLAVLVVNGLVVIVCHGCKGGGGSCKGRLQGRALQPHKVCVCVCVRCFFL